MPYFIKCSLESFAYMRETVVNSPVNLSLCTGIRKTKYSWYPDNIGKPAITFDGCNKEWVYTSEEQRDSEFDMISTIQTKENRS